MTSSMTERIEPHRKAQFSLRLGQHLGSGEASMGGFRSVKYNHKPAQTAESRTATLASLSTDTYSLTLADTDESRAKETFTFKGQGAALTKSYVIVLDAASQQATLEPLTNSYTFNLATKNGKDISAQYPPIAPPKHRVYTHDGTDDDDELFAEAGRDDDVGDPDPSNPYDFRHFLTKGTEKRGDESEYHGASSPEDRTATRSAANTPHFGARKSAAATVPKSKPTKLAPAKRKAAVSNPLVTKPKRTQPPPEVRLQRTATDALKAKAKHKATAPPASKIKSAEVIHSSDESDDADGETASSPPAHARPASPSHAHQQQSDEDEDEDDGDSDDHGGLEIEVPDAQPPRRGNGALKSRGLGRNLGVGAFTRSPSNGPISLLSATSSARGSPNPQSLASRANRNTQDEIGFGDLEDAEGEEDEDEDYNRDIEPMDIGPPARHDTTLGAETKTSAVGAAVEDDEDDLEKMMMEGLAGDSSEESEEE